MRDVRRLHDEVEVAPQLEVRSALLHLQLCLIKLSTKSKTTNLQSHDELPSVYALRRLRRQHGARHTLPPQPIGHYESAGLLTIGRGQADSLADDVLAGKRHNERVNGLNVRESHWLEASYKHSGPARVREDLSA